MRVDPLAAAAPQRDDWLEGQCRRVQQAAAALAAVVGEINSRTCQARAGLLGRRRRITDSQLRQAEDACRSLHDVLVDVQNALFDCEHELRALREREVDPAELLVDGERLIRQYRFLRRRARIMDGLLAYLPSVTQHAQICRDHLRQLRLGTDLDALLRVPDWTFALAALEQLQENESVDARPPAAGPGPGPGDPEGIAARLTLLRRFR